MRWFQVIPRDQGFYELFEKAAIQVKPGELLGELVGALRIAAEVDHPAGQRAVGLDGPGTVLDLGLDRIPLDPPVDPNPECDAE